MFDKGSGSGCMKAYILADDLSGALEVASSYHSSGYPVSVRLAQDVENRLAVHSTETRNETAASAARRVEGILREELKRGNRLWFKKIDSTLRGPVGAELKAMTEVLDLPLVVFCPANPVMGRTVVASRLHVNGVPLEQSAFRQDPHWPMRTGELDSILQGYSLPLEFLSLETLRHADRSSSIRALVRGEKAVLISDAATETDLAQLVSATLSVCPDAAFVGANGLARALAKYHGLKPVAPFQARVAGNLLLVCGSRHPASHRQIDALLAATMTRLVTVHVGQSTRDLANAVESGFKTTKTVVLRISPQEHGSPQLMLRLMGEVIDTLKTRLEFPTCCISGGESVALVCDKLGGQRLDLLGTFEDALVASELHRRSGPPLRLFTKPGGYGDAQLLNRFVASLR